MHAWVSEHLKLKKKKLCYVVYILRGHLLYTIYTVACVTSNEKYTC